MGSKHLIAVATLLALPLAGCGRKWRQPTDAAKRTAWTWSLLIPAGVGLAVFPVLYGVHEAWWRQSGDPMVPLVTLFFVTFATLSLCGATWRGAVAMWVGVLMGMTFVSDSPAFFIVVIAVVLTSGAVLLGTVAAFGLRDIRRAWKRRKP